jgi:voltage-gated potassium channel
MPSPFHFSALRHWAASVAVTVILLALIAAAVGGETWEVSGTVLIAVVAVATLLHRLFPGSRFFTITFANAIGVYACLYVSFLETLYLDVSSLPRLVGFLLPIVAFAIGVYLRREAIHSIVSSEHPRLETRFGRAFLWLVPVLLVGLANFVAPLEAIGHEGRTIWLLAAMAAIGLVVLLASRNVAVFLIDTGLLFEDFFEIMSGLVKPAFAFLTFYSMMVILFATLYRLLGRLDDSPTFLIDGIGRDPTFVESLYFSIVTLSTVGYGDVVPLTYAARIVVALQIVAGVLLLLFGFHALMRHTGRGS